LGEGALVAFGVAEEFTGAEGFEGDGGDVVVAGEGEGFGEVAFMNEGAEGEEDDVAEAGGDGGGEGVGVVGGDATEAEFAGFAALVELVEEAAGSGGGMPIGELGAVVEGEEVDVGEVEAGEGGVDLFGDGAVEVVDFVDEEDAVAGVVFEGCADDLFGEAVFIVGGGVNDVEAGIEGAAEGGDAGVEGEGAVGEVAGAEGGGEEGGAAEGARCEVWGHRNDTGK
jgi:hypothetical protein